MSKMERAKIPVDSKMKDQKRLDQLRPLRLDCGGCSCSGSLLMTLNSQVLDLDCPLNTINEVGERRT